MCKVFNVEPKPFGGFKRENQYQGRRNSASTKKVREDGTEYDASEEADEDEALDASEKAGFGQSKPFDPFSDASGTMYGLE